LGAGVVEVVDGEHGGSVRGWGGVGAGVEQVGRGWKAGWVRARRGGQALVP
jgi:hypothetical protein